MQIVDSFLPYFRPDDLEQFDEDPSIIYGLTPELTLGLLNDAWLLVARANQAPPDFFDRFGLGGSYLEGISAPLKPFFEGHLRESIESGQSWEFDYQCPVPHQFRMFRMQVLPLTKVVGSEKTGSEKVGCLVTNASIVEIPRPEDDQVGAEDVLAAYLRDEESVTQCSHCRRTRRVDAPSRWDWVPQLVWERPVAVSHSICPPCFAYYYPPVPRR